MNEMTEEYISSYKEDLEKAIEHQKREYLAVRAGRANPHILDRVTVDYYGVQTPIIQMANISVPEARMLLISVWDQTQVKAISKAISEANLGVSPSDDGRAIRLVFPAPTEERRKDLVKQVKKIGEDVKVNLRNARRDVLDIFKQMKKDSELSEDELATLEKEVQKIVDSYTAKADDLSAAKEKEVMEI